MTHRKEKYLLSFTAASSMLPDFTRLALLAAENEFNLEKLSAIHLAKEKGSTKVRQFRELKHRLKTLTREEMNLLANGSLMEQKQLTLLAICKTYRFIFDFVVEVIREKALVYDYEIRESDYNSFINRKLYDHPELESLSPSSQKKIKTVLFRMLAEIGLIDNARSKMIQTFLISDEVAKLIVRDNPELLKIFLNSDREIDERFHDY